MTKPIKEGQCPECGNKLVSRMRCVCPCGAKFNRVVESTFVGYRLNHKFLPATPAEEQMSEVETLATVVREIFGGLFDGEIGLGNSREIIHGSYHFHRLKRACEHELPQPEQDTESESEISLQAVTEINNAIDELGDPNLHSTYNTPKEFLESLNEDVDTQPPAKPEAGEIITRKMGGSVGVRRPYQKPIMPNSKTNTKSPAKIAAEKIRPLPKGKSEAIQAVALRGRQQIVTIITEAYAEQDRRFCQMAALILQLHTDALLNNDTHAMVKTRLRDYGLYEAGFLKEDITEAAERYEEER